MFRRLNGVGSTGENLSEIETRKHHAVGRGRRNLTGDTLLRGREPIRSQMRPEEWYKPRNEGRAWGWSDVI